MTFLYTIDPENKWKVLIYCKSVTAKELLKHWKTEIEKAEKKLPNKTVTLHL